MSSEDKRNMDDQDEELNYAYNLIEKLTKNEFLNQQERMYTAALIRECDNDDSDDDSGTEVKAEEKDACTQTDEITHNKDGEASTSCKKSPADRLMDETFFDRRCYVFTDRPSVEDMKQKYPNLFTASEMRKELERIFYPGKCDEFIQRILYYAQVVIDESDCELFMEKTQLFLDKAPSEKERNYIRQVAMILLIPPLVKEDMGFVRKEYEFEELLYPYICSSSGDFTDLFGEMSYKVIAEHILIAETDDFLEAVLIYFASYYVFDIAYNPYSINTNIFMEKLLLNATDTDDFEIKSECKKVIELISSKKPPFVVKDDCN